ncbi:hypothetical protein ILYODFUR_012806 [Ilyodon furcidens]|uniref:Uncharacterized protein n=1 Tax=Ilyodon furcidens TaxID=33524 RepID=A0ABV0URJ2_9TELE
MINLFMNMNKVVKPVGKEGRDRSDDKENLYDREQVVERNSSSLKKLKKVEGESRWWRATRAAHSGPTSGSWGSWCLSPTVYGREVGHAGQVAKPSQGNTETDRTNNHAHTHSHLRAI